MTADHLDQIIDASDLKTPAFVFLEDRLLENCTNLRRITDAIEARPLYSLKALSLPALLPAMAKLLDGFSASSLFEARLAREAGGKTSAVHLASPVLRPQEVPSLAALCDVINLNSLGQLQRYGEILAPHVELGLRINPGLSVAGDPRYDPCVAPSRLGVPLDAVQAFIATNPVGAARLRGLHIHTNCESEDFNQLYETVGRLISILRQLGPDIAWVNLGGGYYFPDTDVPEALQAAVALLRQVNPALAIYLEPGTAIAQDAGVLVTTVLDIIEQSPTPLLILDTTINHLPEVFDYRYMPVVHGARDDGRYRYRLTGCSCLAGDVFGDCRFASPLKVGSRVCLMEAGSYSLVKANMFNGIPAPQVYLVKADGSRVIFDAPSYEKWTGLYA